MKNLNNLTKHFTVKNIGFHPAEACGIALLGLISFIILLIIILAIRLLYLKIQLKSHLRNFNNLNYLSFQRRNLKNAETFKFKFDKELMKEFTFFCKSKKITKSSFLEKIIIESLKKGVKSNG